VTGTIYLVIKKAVKPVSIAMEIKGKEKVKFLTHHRHSKKTEKIERKAFMRFLDFE